MFSHFSTMGGSSSPINLIDFDLPADVIFEILLRVDDRTLFKCRLINKEFYTILNSSSFWMAKCFRSNVSFPKKWTNLAKDFLPNYRRIYWKKPYGRNFIRNPSGEDDKKFWTLVKNGGDGFRIEKPPAGVDVEDFASCFATSYHWCFKEQLIDLTKEGCDLEIIDHLQPPITVSEWTAARFDCAATHVLRVFLLRSKKRRPEFRNMQEFEGKVGFHDRFYPFDGDNDEYREDDSPPEPEHKSPNEHLNPIIDVFSKITSMEQSAGPAWKEVSHKFENYGTGLRYILFQSMGIDNQFWAGHYGPKMAKSSVTLTFQ